MSILAGNVKVSEAERREHDTTLWAKRVTQIPNNLQERYDYGARTDGQPEKIGYAPSGLSQNSYGWLVIQYAYDGDGFVLSKKIARESLVQTTEGGTASWSGRSGYTYE